jgi:bifunctional UDP-N-acetylglucosamine pyrophosphorylase/glucosamine-1-phosphate N-acetyltransferase
LRPGTRLHRGVKVGNFVEIKNAEVEENAKVPHLSYVGDASIGAASNIGAGTITCNYDGKKKHRTEIGRGVFVGSNSTLVAPLNLGDGCFIAAGSVITKDVPPDALAFGRARQEIKADWAKRWRE